MWWLLAVPPIAIWALLWPAHLIALYIISLFIPALVVLLVIPCVEVGPDGLRLNRVNRLLWSDIVGAESRVVFGLPYLKVRKSWGIMDWWFPLYLRRADEFRNAVQAFGPGGNPMREAVEAYFTQQGAAADAAKPRG